MSTIDFDAGERPSVLHLIPTLGGGGAERQLGYLCEHLPNRDWKCHVASIAGGPNLAPIIRSGATHHMLKAYSAYDPRLIVQVRGLMKTIRPSVIHTWLTMMDVVGGLASVGSSIPWVMSERNALRSYRNQPKMIALRLLALRATSIVSNSIPGKEDWDRELAARFVKVSHIPNVVPVQKIQALASRTGHAQELASDDDTILCAGRLEPQKNIDTLLEALDIMLSSRPEVRVVICGQGSLEGKVLQFSESAERRERVTYVGYAQDLWRRMASASVFVSISLFEGMPNAVLEAAAVGCPVVLSDIPAHRALFTREEAFFVRGDRAFEVARSIEFVLAQRAEASGQARRAMQRLEDWSPERIAEAYASHYEELLRVETKTA